MEESSELKTHEKILIMASLIDVLFTTVPLIVTIVIMSLIFTVYEVIFVFGLLFLSIVAGSIAVYSAWTRSSTFYLFLYFVFYLLISILLTIFAPIWVLVPLFNAAGIWATLWIPRNCSHRKFIPRFRSIKAICLCAIAISSLGATAGLYYYPPRISYRVEPRSSDSTKDIEINFSMANISEIPDDLLDVLNRSNNIDGINVSIEFPVLEMFILNTSLVLGREIPDRDDYIGPIGNYSTLSDYRADLDEYENAINQFSENISAWVSSKSLSELEGLPAEYFDTGGILVTETKKLAEAGIAVDYMPLLGLNKYINDKTIQRVNKTFTLMKKWIDLNDLGKKHRGIIFDTERDWGNDLDTISMYYNFSTHDSGLRDLGSLIAMTKKWEYEWKGGLKHGSFSEERYKRYVVAKKLSYVGSATFGVHLDDLWDGDDAQQNLFKISILPEMNASQFDYVGVMTYETGPDSEEAVYSYIRAGDFFLGNACVPYIYSGIGDIAEYKDNPKQYIDDITKKFMIARDYGYTLMGIWCIMHLYCFSEFGTGWCGGLYDFLKAFGDVDWIYQMCLNLTEPKPVSFSCGSFRYAYAHPALTLLDTYLISDVRYSKWPIPGTSRIRPEEFLF